MDKGGLEIWTALGVGGGITASGLGSIGSVGLSPVADYRISYNDSTKTIENYQPWNPDDGMSASDHHGRWYWERLSILLVNFMPVDNEAYYWWHKWHYARGQQKDQNGRQPYGFFPLGATLHSIQDMTLWMHANAVLLPGHAELEGHIGDGFDIQQWALPPDAPGSDFFAIKPEQDWEFYRSIAVYLHSMYQLKVNSVLHPRKLAHFVQDTLNAANQCDDLAAPGLNESLLAGYNYRCADTVIRDLVIPLAVAASTAIILEGTQPDDSAYYALASSLSMFEKVPTTNNVAMSRVTQSGTQTTPEIDPHDSLGLRYVARQQRAIDARAAFLAGQMTTGELLQVVFEEQARGKAIEAGVSLDETAIQNIGKSEIDKMKAGGQFFLDGSLPKLEQARACAELVAADANHVPQSQKADWTATCNGTKDSDGDGVPDLYDQCLTSPDLLAGGATVGQDGCMFAGSEPARVNTNATNPHAMVVYRQVSGPDGGSP